MANTDVKTINEGGDNFVAKIQSWPKQLREYVQELQNEMRKVTWPSAKQVRATTTVVIVAVFAFAAYFSLVDQILGRAITRIFTAFAK